MKRKLHIVFIFFALLGFALPILRFNTKGTVSEKEKRNLAAKPYILKENRLNQNLFAEYSAYFDDRFGGRQKLISLNKQITYKILRASIYNDRAIKGKGNWYFYTIKTDGDNLSDFYKTNLMTETELSEFKNRLLKATNWCKEQNIPFVFLICPNKHSVYSEFYPFDRPAGITRADQITAIFDELDIPYVFPRDYLISRKKDFDYPFYWETETHWNSQGAYLAFTLLKEKIQEALPEVNFPSIEYESGGAHSSKLSGNVTLLGLEDIDITYPVIPKNWKFLSEYFVFTKPDMSKVGDTWNDFYFYLRDKGNETKGGVHTKSTNENLPRALIFRDSFFRSMIPFVSPLFSETEYMWKHFTEADKDYILQFKPDIIIFENVERYAPTIVQ